ncbi:MAG: hypothetical protein IT372_41705 [Polyangiaceae bacterium]|nr:hypothetical protein [Polyangiaceae bacterium]
MRRQTELEEYCQFESARRGFDAFGSPIGSAFGAWKRGCVGTIDADFPDEPWFTSEEAAWVYWEQHEPSRREPAHQGSRSATHAENNPKIAALEARVQALERIIAQFFDTERVTLEEVEVPDPPHVRWIEANRERLEAYRDSFIALDPEKGILVHAEDGDEFEAKLGDLSPEERDRVVLFHASMYVR